MSENTLLLKSNDEFIDIKCNNADTKQIAIPKYSIIHLKSDCQITAVSFSVSKHHRDYKDNLLEEQFKIIPYTDIDIPTLEHVTSLHNHTNFLHHISNNLSHTLARVRKSDAITQSNLDNLGVRMNTHSYISWSLIGVISLAVSLSVFWSAKICITKRRSVSNTAGTNTS